MKKILVVDDQLVILNAIKYCLLSTGKYAVDCAANGYEAASKMLESKYSCIFLDIMMPGIDGIEVCRNLRSHPETSSTPVIITTGLSDEATVKEAIKAGASDYIVKPFNSKIILKKVKRWAKISCDNADESSHKWTTLAFENVKSKERANTKRPCFKNPALDQIKKRIPGEELDKGKSLLERFGRDLTCEAWEGKLGPFIGRRKELLQIIQTLARLSKSNPVIVGEAGVGKTAIVEALAVRIIEGKDPHVLNGKRIIELNMSALVGGTKYRGEFEERLEEIIKEAQNRPEVIIFIDELHTVIGAGRAGGSIDAADIMKPALARGDIRCIGATTVNEYQRFIERDPALERRFEKVIVNEPSRDEALEILKGIRPKMEEHHDTRISDQALEAAVDLSIRFDPDHQLPDKAIDLVDKAGSRAQISKLKMMGNKDTTKTVSYDDISHTGIYGEVTKSTIARVLSERIDVPYEVIRSYLEGMGQCRLLDLEKTIKESLIGQDEAVSRVCERLLMAHANLSKRQGPLAVFLFIGPGGVGKTELAKLIAEFLLGSKSDMIRLDMSEYTEEHSVAKLIGSPPGYVGHGEDGQLTGRLRKKHYSVVLLDEIEKAHLKVFDLFYQLFDDGRLTDSKGRTVDARNAIFIMTSNISIDKRIGFIHQETEQTKTATLKELAKHFRPEFINRLDEVIVFRTLDEKDVRKILMSMIGDISENLKQQHKVTLEIEKEAEEFLVGAGYNPQNGIRELRRVVDCYIRAPLSRLILNGNISEHVRWKVCYGAEGVTIIPYGKRNGRRVSPVCNKI